jgi:hypothetical protein
VELEQHHLSLTQRQRRERLAHGRATLDVLERLRGVPSAELVCIQLTLGLASTAAELIKCGIPSDGEEPRARGSPAMVETRTGSVEPLEREPSHILGRGPVAEQRDGVCVHVGRAPTEEGIKRRLVEATAPGRRNCRRSMVISGGHECAHYLNYVERRESVTRLAPVQPDVLSARSATPAARKSAGVRCTPLESCGGPESGYLAYAKAATRARSAWLTAAQSRAVRRPQPLV